MAKRLNQTSRLAIGPLNQAGQANEWADAVSKNLKFDASSFARDGIIASRLRGVPIKDKAHGTIPHYRVTPSWMRRLWIDRVLQGASHLLNESNSAIFGDARSDNFRDEIHRFQETGVHVGVVFHGSDIRDPRLSMELNEHSFFRDAPEAWVQRLSVKAARNRAEIGGAGVPIFVSTPDLLADLPAARWLPLSINVDHWNLDDDVLVRDVPRVLHRPSRSVPPIKGTQYIEPVLSELESEGLIRYVRSEAVPHSQMRALVRKVDIVVDQIQTGSYGVAAIEAMAAGRLVVGNVSEFSRGVVSDKVPIVNADPVSFRRVMLEVLAREDQMRAVAAEGKAFVGKWHDGRASARTLQSFTLT